MNLYVFKPCEAYTGGVVGIRAMTLESAKEVLKRACDAGWNDNGVAYFMEEEPAWVFPLAQDGPEEVVINELYNA